MKVNYNKIMHEQISSFGYKPKLLLHCCCAPCSSAVIEKIKVYFDITFYFYNPNIYPQQEYETRKQEFLKLGVNVISENYNHDEFLNVVKGYEKEKEGGARCKICIAQRMNKAFEYAKMHNFEYVTTTLSISPHKNATKLNEIGKELSDEYKVDYLYSDFKKKNGFKRSIELSAEYNLYRQDYCGCVYSMRMD